MAKRIVILGSTGSIGKQALQVVDEFPGDYQVIALAAGSNISLLAEQIKKYKPLFVSVSSNEARTRLKELFPVRSFEIMAGNDGMMNLAKLSDIDLLLVAVSGIHGLMPTLAAIENKTSIALANKETLVTAGSLVMKKAMEKGVRIVPLDSEHSAIFQCFEDENKAMIERLILTASGGPFLNWSAEELGSVTPQEALQHPKWQMGVKITIDSAGLINKGLEVIEAHWLFDIPYEKIKVVIHPQSIIHSMVEYVDGSILAQMGRPDMRTPIQYAFTFPLRRRNSFPKLNLFELKELTFKKPDLDKFPGLFLAFEAGKAGGTMPSVYNAANEAAVEMFLNNKIRFNEIPVIIEKVMNLHKPTENFNAEDILEIDNWARQVVMSIIN